MTYNELAQVLETKNPATGQLYKLSDLNVFKMASPQVGTAMLEDNVFVRGDWLSQPVNQKTAVAFLKASFQGWIYCRDHQSECVDIVLKNGSLLGKGHQTWQMNEINKLDLAEHEGDRPRAGRDGRPDDENRQDVRRDQEHAARRDELHLCAAGRRPAEGGRRRRQRQELEAGRPSP